MSKGRVGGATQLVGGEGVSHAMKVKRAREIRAAEKHEKRVQKDKERLKNTDTPILLKKKDE